MSPREQALNIFNSLSEEQLAAFVTLFGDKKSDEAPNAMTCFYCKGEVTEATTTFADDTDEHFFVIRRVPCFKCTRCENETFVASVAKRLAKITQSFEQSSMETAIAIYSDN